MTSSEPEWPEKTAVRIQYVRTADELSKIWLALGVTNAMDGFRLDPERGSGLFKDYCGLAASVVRHRRRSDADHLRVVTVKGCPSSWDWHHLVFLRTNGIWRIQGVLFNETQKYQDPKVRFIETGSRPWLVVRYLDFSGTGIFLENESWYDPLREGCPEVLTYPVKGHVYPWNDRIIGVPMEFNRDIEGKIVATAPKGAPAEVTVRFRADYSVEEQRPLRNKGCGASVRVGDMERVPHRLLKHHIYGHMELANIHLD